MSLPGSFKAYSLDDVPFLVSDSPRPQDGNDVLLASGQVGGGSPAWRLLPGTVVVLDTPSGKWYRADDAVNGDRGSPAVKSTSGYSAALGDVIIQGSQGTISVTLTTGTGTATEARDDLNADPIFASHYIASESGGELVITSREVGSEEHFHIDPASADRGFSEGETNAVRGGLADYRVLRWYEDLQDLEGNAVDSLAKNYRAGHFSLSQLTACTADAKVALEARGSRIDP